ncbi:MAG: hypothetical protein Q4G46_12730 [Propionibacteriaceae bacterium]|nr:hypothetical protein [Propionibacteriaceae bacterium]
MDSEESLKEEFIRGYTGVLVSSWSDSAYASRLENDPERAVREAGLELPPGVRVDLVREPARTDDRPSSECLDEQFDLWKDGLRSGTVVLHVPHTPVVDAGSLSLSELEQVSGGGAIYCCCCPCSCSL